MIIWGGSLMVRTILNTGGRYNPSTDSLDPTSISNAPTARADHTAVWTGSEMIVWGGDDVFNFSTPAVDILPARTVGQPPAQTTRPPHEPSHSRYGLAAK